MKLSVELENFPTFSANFLITPYSYDNDGGAKLCSTEERLPRIQL